MKEPDETSQWGENEKKFNKSPFFILILAPEEKKGRGGEKYRVNKKGKGKQRPSYPPDEKGGKKKGRGGTP